MCAVAPDFFALTDSLVAKVFSVPFIDTSEGGTFICATVSIDVWFDLSLLDRRRFPAEHAL